MRTALFALLLAFLLGATEASAQTTPTFGEKAVGSTDCKNGAFAADFDTLAQCTSTSSTTGTMQKAPIFVGAVTSPPYPSTTCDSSKAGMMQYTASAMQYCNGTAWTGFGAGSAGANAQSIIAGWPDAIKCTNGSSVYIMTPAALPASNGLAYYKLNDEGATAYVINFTYATGAYNAHANMTGFDCLSKSIAQLIADGQAFNIANGQAGGTAEMQDGTAGAPGLYFSADPNTGFYRPAADTVAIATAGVERFRINAAGNIGLGASDPTTGSNLDLSSKTDSVLLPKGTDAQRPTGVAGMIRYNTTSNSFEVYQGSTPAWVAMGTGSGTSVLGASTATASPYRSGEANTGLFSRATGEVNITSLGTEVVRVGSNGAVKLGNAAATAGTILDLASGTGTAKSSILLPKDTTANRPGTGVAGMMRYNTTDNVFEGYNGTGWVTLGAAAGTIGEITAWPTATVPTGYLECNGDPVSRTTYASLFAVIGTTYGPGDGTTTFNLPDYRGEFLRGWAHGSTNDPDSATRTNRGDGTTGDNVGTKQGSAYAAHTHVWSQYWTGNTGGVLSRSSDGFVYGSVTGGGAQNSTTSAGGNETRGRNVNVMYVIRYATTGSAGSGGGGGGGTSELGASSGAASPYRTGEANTGFFSPSSGTVAVTSLGTERLRITSTGSVGIGTASPGQKLTVAGVIESTSGGIKFPDGTLQTTAGGESAGALDSYASSVVSLLHFDRGMEDEGNLSWSDGTTGKEQAKFGRGSLYCGYQTPTARGNFTNLAGQFTVDFWVYVVSFTGSSDLFFSPSSLTNGLQIGRNGATSSWGVAFLGTSWVVTTTTMPTTGAWTHLAVTRDSSNVVRLFVNGVIANSATNSGTFLMGTTWMLCGNGFTGYIDEFRLTKNVARWTANFTPPTEPTTTGD